MRLQTTKIIAYSMFTIGIVSLTVSAFYASSILSFIGLGLTFWGALLLYLSPARHVKLEVMNAIASSTLANTESFLENTGANLKGIYLPPKYLKDFESSLVFVPFEEKVELPGLEETEERKLYSQNPKGIFMTPPGLALSRLMERELETSFTRTDLKYVQERLPKLLIEDMEIAENAEVETEEKGIINITISKHIFQTLINDTRELQKTYRTMGSPLSSALACALAKATGKPVTIEKEEQDKQKTTIRYRVIEE